jgi:hypothetical protein
MSWNDHPDPLEISDWLDDFLDTSEADRIAAHLERCDDCSGVAGRGPLPLDAKAWQYDAFIGLPEHVVDAFASIPPMPERGQLWQVSWGDDGDLALVVDVDGPNVSVVPAEPDRELADDHTITVPDESSFADIAGALWAGLRIVLPLRVLHTCFGTLDEDVLDRVDDASSGRVGDGAAITSWIDERAQVRSAIEARFERLADATWIPASPPVTVDVTEVARSRGVKPSDVAAAMGVPVGDAREILESRRPIPAAGVDAFASLLAIQPAALAAQPIAIPAGLVAALDSPRFRRPLQERALLHGESEADYRYYVATQALPRRFRRQAGTETDWFEVVEDFLREQ